MGVTMSKREFLFLICIGGLLLFACAKPTVERRDAPTKSPPSALPPVITALSSSYPPPATAPVEGYIAPPTPQPTLSPGPYVPPPTQTPWPTAFFTLSLSPTLGPSETPWPTPLPPPTLLPTIKSTQLPGLLSAITLRLEDGLSSHSLKRITGWAYGFRSPFCGEGAFQWLDSNHLLLRAVIGEYEGMGDYVAQTVTVIVNLDTGRIWWPTTETNEQCRLPFWSESLQKLIAVQNGEMLLFDPDGDHVQQVGADTSSEANLSPSGRWLLTSKIRLDLQTGQAQPVSLSIDWPGIPAWSTDETRMFRCCAEYADFETNQYIPFDLGLQLAGRGCAPGGCVSSQWVLNDMRVIVQDTFDGRVVPLIDPATQTYENIQMLAGINPDLWCGVSNASPDGDKVVLGCSSLVAGSGPQTFIVDLRSFSAQSLPSEYFFSSWSPDSQYVLFQEVITQTGQSKGFVLFPVESSREVIMVGPSLITPIWWNHQLVSLKEDQRTLAITNLKTGEQTYLSFSQPMFFRINWNPQKTQLAFTSQTNRTPLVIDLANWIIIEVKLPRPVQEPRQEIVWSPQGTALAVLAEDGSLWWIPDPAVDRVEQLTPPLPNVRDVRWSPSGDQIAFVSEADIYIVRVIQN